MEGSRGIEAPEIFLRSVDADKLRDFKEKLNANDLSVISTEKNPYMSVDICVCFFCLQFCFSRLAAVLLEWLRELPLSVIPPDMFVLFSEAEKVREFFSPF